MYDSYYVIVRSDNKITDLAPSTDSNFEVQIPNNFTKRFPNTGNCTVEVCNVLLHRDSSGTLENGYIDIRADFKQENVYDTDGETRSICLFATPQTWAASTTISHNPPNPMKIKTSFPLSFVRFHVIAISSTADGDFEDEIDETTIVLKITPDPKTVF